ncbi:hypothetical protein HK102_013001 [Quaeritorhiza haematococci]|nr:hypothetical protein HK102_013001 [Quaeritorhiza haematococci]
MGPCNNGTFTLPEVDANGIPRNFPDVAKFYNTANFSQVIPSLAAQNIQPPCYDVCKKAVDAILQCQGFRSFGLNAGADPCLGLPTTNCAATIGPKGGASPTAGGAKPSTTAKAGASATPTSGASFVNVNVQTAASFVVMVASLFATLF